MSGDKVSSARLVLGGVAPKPWRCKSTEQFLTGKTLSDETLARAGAEALEDARALAENAYKIPLTKVLIARALHGAATRSP